MISSSVASKARSLATSTSYAYSVQVGIKVSDKGKVSRINAGILIDTSGKDLKDFLRTNPKDKSGTALIFKLRMPREEEGSITIKTQHTYTATALLELIEYTDSFDFTSLLHEMEGTDTLPPVPETGKKGKKPSA